MYSSQSFHLIISFHQYSCTSQLFFYPYQISENFVTYWDKCNRFWNAVLFFKVHSFGISHGVKVEFKQSSLFTVYYISMFKLMVKVILWRQKYILNLKKIIKKYSFSAYQYLTYKLELLVIFIII